MAVVTGARSNEETRSSIVTTSVPLILVHMFATEDGQVYRGPWDLQSRAKHRQDYDVAPVLPDIAVSDMAR
ncbi:unnamed protein product [Fusarium graminearum]|nr:unnamed protein product [Fusarium graminearum]VTO88274.1 unnamed protein product [Fusarium graminearum]